jgi:hypothetical protein
MEPRFYDGEILYYDAPSPPPEMPDKRRTYVVWCEDGRVLVKMMHKGASQGCYHLFSYNQTTEPMFDVPVRQVARVIFSRHR